MPLFNWDAADPSEIRKPRFYIYWVVTLPCTFLVIAVWILWIRINNQVESRVELDSMQQPKAKDPPQPQKGCRNPFSIWKKSLTPRRLKRGAVSEAIDDEEADLEEPGQGSTRTSRKKLSSLFHIHESSKQA